MIYFIFYFDSKEMPRAPLLFFEISSRVTKPAFTTETPRRFEVQHTRSYKVSAQLVGLRRIR